MKRGRSGRSWFPILATASSDPQCRLADASPKKSAGMLSRAGLAAISIVEAAIFCAGAQDVSRLFDKSGRLQINGAPDARRSAFI